MAFNDVLSDFGRGLMQTNTWQGGIAQGLNNFDERKKKAGLAAAFQSISGQIPERLRPLLSQLEPEQAMQFALPMLTQDPLEQQLKQASIAEKMAIANYWKGQGLDQQGTPQPTTPGSPLFTTQPQGQQVSNPFLKKAQVAARFGDKATAEFYGSQAQEYEKRAQAQTPFGQMDPETKLRTEFTGTNKHFAAIKDAFTGINAAATSATPAGDLSMLYQYVKMLDPTSVVRESEFATAQTAAPFLTRVGLDPAKLQGLWAGNRLTPDQRVDFLNTAKSLYGNAKNEYDKSRMYYQGLATQYGLNPERVTYGAPDTPGMATVPVAAAKPSPTIAAPKTQGGPPLVTTKAQFDALPKGAPYMEDDGKVYYKP